MPVHPTWINALFTLKGLWRNYFTEESEIYHFPIPFLFSILGCLLLLFVNDLKTPGLLSFFPPQFTLIQLPSNVGWYHVAFLLQFFKPIGSIFKDRKTRGKTGGQGLIRSCYTAAGPEAAQFMVCPCQVWRDLQYYGWTFGWYWFWWWCEFFGFCS